MKLFTSKTQKIGESGENEAEKYLKSNGFSIIERNYTKKWGEIDIIAQKSNILHFVEVKSATITDVSRETLRPEENMHHFKIKRLGRTIETYLLEKDISDNQLWQFDLICVYLKDNIAVKIDFLEDIILS
jgi:putative endonuclease